MSEDDDLHFYLQAAREALLWKLDGLPEYVVRRPLTPTGTNLLGLVKHATYVESGYLGDTFGYPSGLRLPWLGGVEPGSEFWATADESRTMIIDGYRQAWTRSDAAIAELTWDAVGHVPWWPDGDDTISLHHAVVRVLADTQRHAGHADILRESIDGAVGMNEDNASLPSQDPAWWLDRRTRIEEAANAADRLSRSLDQPGW
ncbi:DinB family protein [Microlunatus sp. GCM10028923]|uniref:DinB family protein n=1 Tax=Microlunatus sp. GCM10028923 TaxID=3273400 RepID=UPI003612EDFB